jgi:hypothetical protein
MSLATMISRKWDSTHGVMSVHCKHDWLAVQGGLMFLRAQANSLTAVSLFTSFSFRNIHGETAEYYRDIGKALEFKRRFNVVV